MICTYILYGCMNHRFCPAVISCYIPNSWVMWTGHVKRCGELRCSRWHQPWLPAAAWSWSHRPWPPWRVAPWGSWWQQLVHHQACEHHLSHHFWRPLKDLPFQLAASTFFVGALNVITGGPPEALEGLEWSRWNILISAATCLATTARWRQLRAVSHWSSHVGQGLVGYEASRFQISLQTIAGLLHRKRNSWPEDAWGVDKLDRSCATGMQVRCLLLWKDRGCLESTVQYRSVFESFSGSWQASASKLRPTCLVHSSVTMATPRSRASMLFILKSGRESFLPAENQYHFGPWCCGSSLFSHLEELGGKSAFIIFDALLSDFSCGQKGWRRSPCDAIRLSLNPHGSKQAGAFRIA